MKGKSLGWTQGGPSHIQSTNLWEWVASSCRRLWWALLSIHTNMVITRPASLWLMGTMELRRVDIRVCLCLCLCVSVFISFSWESWKERNVHARQVLNGTSNETQWMVMYLWFFFYICACLYVWVFLLVCALHPWAMMAPFLIRTIIVGLSSGSASRPLTLVEICQVNLLRISCDNWILSTSRQQALEFLE